MRQAFQPVFEVPITLRDPDLPIGTHVFTAVKREGADLHWSVVSLSGKDREAGVVEVGYRSTDAPMEGTRDAGAKAALDRVAMPEDVASRITQLMSVRSSLIISDEAPSSEIGTGTEFIVVLSDEPQGGLASRRRGGR